MEASYLRLFWRYVSSGIPGYSYKSRNMFGLCPSPSMNYCRSYPSLCCDRECLCSPVFFCAVCACLRARARLLLLCWRGTEIGLHTLRMGISLQPMWLRTVMIRDNRSPYRATASLISFDTSAGVVGPCGCRMVCVWLFRTTYSQDLLKFRPVGPVFLGFCA